MTERKRVGDSDWWKNDLLSKVILETLPNWEEWWLPAFREVIRRQLGYVESDVPISEEDLEYARRSLASWMKEAPGLDVRHTLTLIDHELARRRTDSTPPQRTDHPDR
ncbi:MAG: hypothetical protein NTW68_13090 [candidate division NC10 bacterium]|nr:hypothetical protein [candidate division NC10 bacterium]